MAKILCVLYDDPAGGYPTSYPRDDLPKIERYPDGQTLPTPSATDFQPGALLGTQLLALERDRLHARLELVAAQRRYQGEHGREDGDADQHGDQESGVGQRLGNLVGHVG